MKKDSGLSDVEKLKLTYNDVLNGYSFYKERGIYLRHFCEKSYAKILQKKVELLESYEKEGLPTLAQREKEIFESGVWNQEKEDRVTQLKYILSDNEAYAKGLLIESQRNALLEILKKDKKELQGLLDEKEAFLGPTIQKFTDKELDNFFIYYFFYKDPEFKEPYFTIDQFENLDNEDLIIHKAILNYLLGKVNEEHVSQIACLPFFLNVLGMVKERPEQFLGKSISLLTFNQHNLISSGLRNLSVVSQSEGSPPSLIDSSLESLVNWYDQQYSVLLGKSKSQGSSGGLNISSKDVLKN